MTTTKSGRRYQALSDTYLKVVLEFHEDDPATIIWDKKVSGLRARIGKRAVTFDYFQQHRIKGERSTTCKRLGHFPLMKVRAARKAAKMVAGRIAAGRLEPGKKSAVKFQTAFADYLEHLERKAANAGKPARWKKNVEQLGRQHLKTWSKWSLAEMSARPDVIAKWHREITDTSGPVSANHAARILRACYRRAARLDRTIPPALPTRGVDFNTERPSEKGLPFDQYAAWGEAWRKIENPIHRAYFWFCLYSGVRPGEASRLRWADVKPRERTVTIAHGKTGAVTIPMSVGIARALQMARDTGKDDELVFPGCAQIGHRSALPARGHMLRHAYRTLATEIGTVLLSALDYISTFISLIERSRLGEFSWPFAEELRSLAKPLLAEPDFLLEEDKFPIIHVVADGRGYRIITEDALQVAGSTRRFVIVLFPRPLKDHVLLHSIFGHELGHAALATTQAGGALLSQVYPALAAGILADDEKATAWLNAGDAPPELKTGLSEYEVKYKEPFVLLEFLRNKWLHELICDLSGLLLFGPSFLAAHSTIIAPSHPAPLKVDLLEPTHPPYGVRHKMLVQAMRILHWHKTITVNADGDYHLAELKLLTELTYDPFPNWAQLFTEDELQNAIDGIKSVFGDLLYVQPEAKAVVALVDRLKNELPPITDGINSDGTPTLLKTDFRQILHAGWIFWGGRDKLSPPSSLSFIKTNKLCNQSLLQQRAVNEFLSS